MSLIYDLEKLNANFVFISPHSCEFNPIEEFFGSVQAKYLE